MCYTEYMKYSILTILILFGALITLSVNAQEVEIRDIAFPVDGEVRFQDDFDQARSGGRKHNATDLIGEKMTPLISAVDGVVTFLPETEPSWGWGVWIRDDEGYEYVYLHVNNDTPGTDDGKGGIEWAFAPDVRQGKRVTRGQFIGYLGDSGNAENIASHLHFEIHRPDGTPLNPYASLVAAHQKLTGVQVELQQIGYVYDYDRDVIMAQATSISHDKQLITAVQPACQADSLIKGQSSTTVYYCGRDGKRYFFPSDRVFFSWYDSFSHITTVSDVQLSQISLGGNVTFKPGSRLVKIQSDPKVYAVDAQGALRWVTSAYVAQTLFGNDWESLLEDVDVAYFINYTVGEPL